MQRNVPNDGEKRTGKSKCGEWKKKAIVRFEHLERGLCRDCTTPAEPGKTMCLHHLRFAVQRKRRWRIYHGLQKPQALYPSYQGRKIVPADSEVPF